MSTDRMSTRISTCLECGIPLIKQLLRNGLPLNPEEQERRAAAVDLETYRLECQSCGNICFHDQRLKTPPPSSGTGLCRRCGGINGTTTPKAFGPLALYNVPECLPMLWSCPVHGTLPLHAKHH